MPPAERSPRFNQPEATAMYGPLVRPPTPTTPKNEPLKAPPQKDSAVAEKLKEKKEPSLGERNPLIYPPDLMNAEAVEAIELVTRRKIEQYGGLQPEMRMVLIPDSMGQLNPRFIARFSVDELPESKIALLEQVTIDQYNGKEVRTRKHNGRAVQPSSYPSVDAKGRGQRGGEEGRYLGWYMGALPPPAGPLHNGLLVHKDVGNAGLVDYFRKSAVKDWFYSDDLVDPKGSRLKTKYNIELRESSMKQTDLVSYITQVATILGKGESLPSGPLLYEVYNDLNRLGLKKNGNIIHGLDEQIDKIDRSLLLPLANLDLSSGIDLKAGSLLLIGVMGTGKTAVIEKKLQEDTGVFLVPVDPKALVADLAAPLQKRTLLPRIQEVFTKTDIPVVLHVDDVESISEYEAQMNSTMLNLMAGVRENGFHLIASTNYPERLNPQLLQPGRFGDVIYFGLHDEEARQGILDKHATQVSKELGKPLFTSGDEREIVLKALAHHTEGFTPRYLAEICKEAKAFYLQRLTKLREQKKGLSEGDIEEEKFAIGDWEKGFLEVNKKYNKKATIDRDKQLQDFAKKHDKSIGFKSADGEKEAQTLHKTIEKFKVLYERNPQNPQ